MNTRKINNKSNIIGKNVKNYRLLRGYSLRELSSKLELLGITLYHSDIFEIENQRKTIKDFEIKALAIALNITLDDLYYNTEDSFK